MIPDLLRELQLSKRPSDQEITELMAKIDFEIDVNYLSFIKTHNGGDGFVNDSFLQLWSIKDLILLNPYCEANIDNGYSNSIFFIGSNGSDTGYGIKKETGSFIDVPFIDMSDAEARDCGRNFLEFLLFLSVKEY